MGVFSPIRKCWTVRTGFACEGTQKGGNQTYGTSQRQTQEPASYPPALAIAPTGWTGNEPRECGATHRRRTPQ
jgi:hypothetical protein